MTFGGGVSIYYSAQSTYIIPHLLDTDSGRSHFFHSDFYVDMFRQGHQNFESNNKKKKKQPTHRKSLPIITQKTKQCQQTLN